MTSVKLSLLFVLLRLATPARAQCGPDQGWNLIEDGCFKVILGQAEARDAEMHCVSLGGHLASIHTATQNSAVQKLFPGKLLLGLTDGDSEGTVQPALFVAGAHPSGHERGRVQDRRIGRAHGDRRLRDVGLPALKHHSPSLE